MYGNVIPEHYLPIKVEENKYYDSKKSQYIHYPATGSFEVEYKGKLLFSKKKTSTWPHLRDIFNKFYLAYKG